MIWPAFKLSMLVVAVATVLVTLTGTAFGFLLAKREFRGKELCDSILTLPMVLPPTVTGYYLIVLLGRNGWAGHYLYQLTGWTLADPLVSAAIGVFIVPRTWGLLRQAVNVLLEGTPSHLALEEIEQALGGAPGVRRVHDLHVWTLTSGREAMSAHVVVDDLTGGERLLERLHALLHSRFGIDHTTIQLETEPPAVLTIKGQRHEARGV